jgi:hypothetical protein
MLEDVVEVQEAPGAWPQLHYCKADCLSARYARDERLKLTYQRLA